jgi:hypothetical protein
VWQSKHLVLSLSWSIRCYQIRHRYFYSRHDEGCEGWWRCVGCVSICGGVGYVGWSHLPGTTTTTTIDAATAAAAVNTTPQPLTQPTQYLNPTQGRGFDGILSHRHCLCHLYDRAGRQGTRLCPPSPVCPLYTIALSQQPTIRVVV